MLSLAQTTFLSSAGDSLFPESSLKTLERVTFSFFPAVLTVCFRHSSVSKEPACDAGGLGSIPGSGRSPGDGDGNSLQYSCLENRMDRGAGGLQSTGLPEPDTT